ncbi:MAG: hypothetical protein IKG69_10060 [Atopobiaceae bacterium]|nr:hypothetical protein [Atopobiaceae bacterium]
MRIVRDIAGYLMGLMLFVALVPAIMWWVAGGAHPTTPRLVVFAVMAVTGIGLSV